MLKITNTLNSMRILIGLICFFSIIALSFHACEAQVSISITHENGGSDDYFVAKHGSSVLWKYDSWGPVLHDNLSAMSVLISSNLLVVDQFGIVRKRLPFDAAHAPRSVFLKNGYLIYDTGALAIAKYDPKTEGKHLAGWLRKVRLVRVFNVRTLHQQWQAPEADVGLPISYNKKSLDTMKIVNITRCLKSRNVTPIVSITEVNVRNKHQLRSAVLSLNRTEAFNLLSAFLDIECVTPVRVNWSATGTDINGLFGGNYHGKLT